MMDVDANVVLVNAQDRVEAMADHLAGEPAFGVDTEANSLYRYHARVCLIQVSVPGRDYIVDPLATDVRPLGPLFASDAVQKVMHAGEYDIMCLRRDYGFDFINVFDTMIAARTLGMAEFGLASLLRRHYGVCTDKSLQRADWGQRPLPDKLLSYAAIDSHYLLGLRDWLQERLAGQGVAETAEQAFRDLCGAKWNPKPFDEYGFHRLPGARRLDRTQLAVLRELYLWREATAEAMDRPPFRVARSELLVRLALMQPRTKAALEMLVGRREAALLERADEVLGCIRRGLEDQQAAEVVGSGSRGRGPRCRKALDRLDRWRRQVAAERGVEPDDVLGAEALAVLAERQPRTWAALEAAACLSQAQMARDGQALLQLLGGEGGRH